jgi:hypothetical protein
MSAVLTSTTIPVTLTGTGNTRTFTMPSAGVTVGAIFAQIITTSGQLQTAINNTVSGTITLPAGTVIDMTSAVTVNKDITITTTAGAAVSLNRNAGNTANVFFNVTGSGNTLILRTGTGGSLTLDGKKDTVTSSDSLVKVTLGGELEINDGVTLTDNMNTGTSGGAVNLASSSILTMNGGTISNNAGRSGGGVYANNSTMTIGGNAVISGNSNSAAMAGGGVYITGSAASLIMTGGTISGNTASTSGGGVYVDAGTFTMTGGTISGNTAPSGGGGVYVYNGIFTKSGGGTIYGRDEGAPNWNKAVNGSSSYDDMGHAVRVYGTYKRTTTAGPTVDLDSSSSTNWE